MTLMVFICFPSLVNIQNRGFDNVRNLNLLDLKLGEILVLNMVVCVHKSHIKNSWDLPTAKPGIWINWEFGSNINMLWIEKLKTGSEITHIRAKARSRGVFKKSALYRKKEVGGLIQDRQEKWEGISKY